MVAQVAAFLLASRASTYVLATVVVGCLPTPPLSLQAVH